MYGHTSLSFLMNCPGFYEAKQGDMHAAMDVARRCVNHRTIDEIKDEYPEAVLLPVAGGNKLPSALARLSGMRTQEGMRKLDAVSRKSLTGMERLLHKPVFDGRIVKGKSYIIVDDVITQGGTVSALRQHVISQGGAVAAAVALSCAIGSRILAPKQQDITNAIERFSLHPLTSALQSYDIACDLRELTRAQLRYMLQFKELEGLIGKIEQTQRTKGLS